MPRARFRPRNTCCPARQTVKRQGIETQHECALLAQAPVTTDPMSCDQAARYESPASMYRVHPGDGIGLCGSIKEGARNPPPLLAAELTERVYGTGELHDLLEADRL